MKTTKTTKSRSTRRSGHSLAEQYLLLGHKALDEFRILLRLATPANNRFKPRNLTELTPDSV